MFLKIQPQEKLKQIVVLDLRIKKAVMVLQFQVHLVLVEKVEVDILLEVQKDLVPILLVVQQEVHHSLVVIQNVLMLQ
jgi:hypothetical protein